MRGRNRKRSQTSAETAVKYQSISGVSPLHLINPRNLLQRGSKFRYSYVRSYYEGIQDTIEVEPLQPKPTTYGTSKPSFEINSSREIHLYERGTDMRAYVKWNVDRMRRGFQRSPVFNHQTSANRGYTTAL